jgi:hypothetical protein
MTDEVNISTLAVWAVVVINALKEGKVPPAGEARASKVRDLQAAMIRTPEWKAFCDADLVMAFCDFKPVSGAQVPRPAAVAHYSGHPAIVSADWRAVASFSQGGKQAAASTSSVPS